MSLSANNLWPRLVTIVISSVFTHLKALALLCFAIAENVSVQFAESLDDFSQTMNRVGQDLSRTMKRIADRVRTHADDLVSDADTTNEQSLKRCVCAVLRKYVVT